MKPVILIVEDDKPYCMDLSRKFEACGFDVQVAHDAGIALDICRRLAPLEWVLIDAYRLPQGTFNSGYNVPFHDSWGVELADWISKNRPNIKIIGYSNATTQDIAEWFKQHTRGYLRKSSLDDSEFSQTLRRVFHIAPARCFIVHGKDTSVRDSLQKLLTKWFKSDNIVILDKQANTGLSIFQKLEREATNTDVAFVLFTADDRLIPPDEEKPLYMQARPNVLIEAGWFLGKFGVVDRRTIFLHDLRSVMPSDFQGLGYIDISRGVNHAANKIELELMKIGIVG